jgi:hypothetical protein
MILSENRYPLFGIMPRETRTGLFRLTPVRGVTITPAREVFRRQADRLQIA